MIANLAVDVESIVSMATSEPPVSNAEAEAFEEELVLEMEQVVTEEELMQGLEQEENVATQNEHMEEIVVEHEEEHDSDQHDGVRYQQSNQSHPSMDAHYEEVPATTTYEPGRPVTRQSALEQSGAAAELQSQSSITRKRFAPPGGAVASDAKVVVLMKSNASGGKPTFVKLEPVAPVTSRSVRAEFARALTTARKSGDGASQAPKRKRRMIPPIIKKDHSALEQSGAAAELQSQSSITRKRFAPPGGAVASDAKVVVLMKSNASGGKPTFVKLEPVAPVTSRSVRAEFARALTTARKSGDGASQAPKRKRRMIPPIIKKDHDDKKTPSRRGRPRKSAVDTLHGAALKKPKTEPPAEEGEREEEQPQEQLTSAGRPKRTHKAPKRFGDYYEEPVALRDPATIPISGLEPEAEEDESEVQSPPNKRTSSAHAKGSEDVVKLQGKEYEDFVARELAKGKLLCEQCHRFFANQNSMNAHRFKVHHIVIRASVKCPGCEHRATTIHTLNDHCAEVHGLKLQFVHRKFNSTNEFQTYLDDLAATQNMAFVRHRKSANKRQLYCNRSGAKRVASDETIRNRPRKGSAKIGAMCPAHMFYTECDDGLGFITASVKCPGCEHRATTIHTLNDHCAEVHGLKLQFVHRKFNSTNEFQTYLDDLAATQNMAFVRHRKSANKRQLYCNRSGAKRVASDETIRNRPRISSAKIGAMCPAHMFYTECDDGLGFITEDEEEEELRRLEEEERLEMEFGPVHPKAEEIDIRMKNIDRLCSFLFDNVSEQLYRLDDSTMEVLLRAEDEEEEELRRLEEEERLEMEFGPVHPKAEEIDIRMKNIDRLCSFLFDNVSEQLYRLDDSTMEVLLRAFANRRRQRQFYDTEDYDEDTVYYRHVPLRPNTDLQNIYLLDDDDDEYYEEY
ncbi:hypothetical protein Tcan_13165 [Toxocara canis]|uniref:C2H2-type domain-containing protein n=1 Tax=Toxocara canis TaxID=6265 RepID=A0A0B2VZ96_TOXCA|nr:hypothetical protein Tcan_13165 [Toxocara canis]